jgi:TRAP-type C4-dicarboxylate transport system substrate-binding protein
MTKNKGSLWVVISLAVIMLTSGSAFAAGEIKLALDCPPDLEKCGTYLWSKTFADELESKGLKIKLYAKDALGGEEERLDQVSQGLLEISNSNLSKAGSLDPTIFGFYLPFLFEDMDHFFRVLANTDILTKINAGTTKQGVRVLALVPVGDMSGIATTKKFIKTPADFKGVRMRALDKKQAKWLEVWGANAVIIPWPEIYNALQTGVADGYMNPAFVPVMFKHTEVLKYYSDAKVGLALRITICSEDWFKGLSDEQRAAVDAAVVKANGVLKAWVKKAEEQGLDTLKKAGVQVYVNSAEEKAKFADLIRPNYKDIVSPEVVTLFVKAAEEER